MYGLKKRNDRRSHTRLSFLLMVAALLGAAFIVVWSADSGVSADNTVGSTFDYGPVNYVVLDEDEVVARTVLEGNKSTLVDLTLDIVNYGGTDYKVTQIAHGAFKDYGA